MKIPSVFFVTRKELFTLGGILWIATISAFYIVLTLFLLNYRFVFSVITAPYSFATKSALLSSLLGGLFTAFSPTDTIILFANAILVGINMLLVARTIYRLEHQGKVRFTIGGSALIGFISAGCSSCGFSILSILGLSTSFSFLPFQGMGLHILALVVLAFSSLYMLKKLRDSVYCKVKK